MSTPAQQQQPVDAPPPQMALMMMMTGYWVSQSIYVAARLGIADALKDGAKSTDELAEATGTHAPTLYRLMRALASLGIFAEDENRRFTLTPLASPLQSGEGSMRAMILHLAEGPSWQAWGELLHSVKTGETAFTKAHGMEVFPFYAKTPESSEPFNQAMTEYSEAVASAVTGGYDFSQFRKVVDIGGGQAGLITSILGANPQVSGVVFDLESVLDGGRRRIEAEGLANRCEAVAGDFFASVPEGGDAYVLKSIIHDWDDERAVAILKNIYEAMRGDGKLLMVETVVPSGNEPSLGKLGDLHMLVMTGGCERTVEEYRTLLLSAGFELTRVIPTESMVSIVEAVKKKR